MAFDLDTKIPVVDIDADYGKFVVSALENGSVDTVLAAPEYTTPAHVVDAFAKGWRIYSNFVLRLIDV